MARLGAHGVDADAVLGDVQGGAAGVRLETTFGGAGVLSGDLSPECAAVVTAVLDALSATFAGVAGVIELANSGNAFPNVNNASGLLLPALASAFLGATTIRPGRFNVPGTLVGVFFIAVAVQGLTLAGVAVANVHAHAGAPVRACTRTRPPGAVLTSRRGLDQQRILASRGADLNQVMLVRNPREFFARRGSI